MRRTFLAVVLLAGTAVVGFGAVLIFPQISEMGIEWTCSIAKPDKTCQNRMVAMGHIWSRKGDLDRAMIWYARAAQGHHPAALFHLAWILEQGGIAELKDFLRDLGDPNSSLAETIDPQNNPGALGNARFDAAKKLYRMAADQGFAPAMNNLAELYVSGLVGRHREEEAFRLHLTAARAGNPIAAMNVSFDYLSGRGVAADPVEAQKWATISPQSDSLDLGTLTLARTRLQGNAADPRVVTAIRVAAERHESVTIDYKPLRPDSRLPTFHQVQDEMQASSSH